MQRYRLVSHVFGLLTAIGFLLFAGIIADGQDHAPYPLGKKAELIRAADPQYPEKARESHLMGDVSLSIIVDAEGNVISLKAKGDPVLAESAKATVKHWQYKPFLLGGKAIPFQASVDFAYRIGEWGFLVIPYAHLGGCDLSTHRNCGIWFGATAVNESSVGGMSLHPPEIDLARDYIFFLVNHNWPSDDTSEKRLQYLFLADKTGNISRLIRIKGPDIPSVENLLRKTKITDMGKQGADPIPCWCILMIDRI